MLKRIISLMLIICLGILAGCGQPESTASPSAPAADNTPQANGLGYSIPGEDTLSLAVEAPIRSADPHVAENALLEGVGEGLVRAYEGGYRPGVALTHTADEGQTVWTFTLREDARWSDGIPITAQTFVDSWRLLASRADALEAASALSMIEGYPAIRMAVEEGASQETLEPLLGALGVTALDDHTLEVTLSQPCPWFLQSAASQALMPIHMGLYQQDGGQYGASAETTGCNGPFVVESWPQEGDLILAANPEYWDADSIALKSVWLRVIPDGKERAAAFAQGAVHAARLDGAAEDALQQQVIQVTGRESGVLLINRMRLDADGSILNEEVSGTLSNNNLTQAISCAIDRTAMASMEGMAMAPSAFLIPGAVAANDSLRQLFGALRVQQEVLSPHPLSADPEAAVNALLFALNETGYSDPQELPAYPMTVADDAASMALAQAIVESVRDTLGITIELVTVSSEECARRAQAGEYDLLLTALSSPANDPLPLLSLFAESETYHNAWRENDPSSHGFYVSMLETAQATLEADIRAAQLIDAEGFLLSFGPVLPIYTQDHIMLRADRVVGVNGRAFGQFFEYCHAYIQR